MVQHKRFIHSKAVQKTAFSGWLDGFYFVITFVKANSDHV